MLFIPDVHIPYHNERAFNLMLKVAKAWNPHVIAVLGDFMDFYAVSSFTKDPARKFNLEGEVAVGNRCLDDLDDLGAGEKIFVEGNHCRRLQTYIHNHADALDGLVSVQQIFRLRDRGWRFVPYRDHYKLGKVYLTHDVNATGRNAVHKIIDTYQHSAITGHTHRIAYAVEADGLGQPILSATFGWLGDLSKVDYQHRILATKAYVLGFGVGYLDESGVLFANPVPIVNYRCLVEGRIYQG